MIVTVGLLPLVSTTVDAADTDNYPYKLWIPELEILYISDSPFYWYSDDNVGNGTGSTYNYIGTGSANTYALEYVNSNEVIWSVVCDGVELLAPHTAPYRYTSASSASVYDGSVYSCAALYNEKGKYEVLTTVWGQYTLYSSHSVAFKSYFGSYVQSIPEELPTSGGLTLEEIMAQLDEQTATGTAAADIITDTTAKYSSYQAGDIDNAEMQSYVSTNLDTLSDLSATTGNTLSDLMQINNAITYNQAIQDNLLNTASGSVQSSINQLLDSINIKVMDYQVGILPQAEAVRMIQEDISNLNRLITDGVATTTADISAVNAAINAANGSLDSVTGYKDLSQEASDKSQQSDQAELDYLDELTAETTATVEQLAPSQNFSNTQTGEAQEVLNLIWENEFVKRLLPMCAGFMVVCVVLGIRYKV